MAAALLTFATAGCASSHAIGRWSVTSIAPDGRTLHLDVDVSCNATIVSSRVHEYRDRVLVDVAVHSRASSCTSVLVSHRLDVALHAPLRNRWIDGACVGGCPVWPDRAPVDCHAAWPPFWFGYLPSGWTTAASPRPGAAAGYQGPDGTSTLELWHDRADVVLAPRGDLGVPTLGDNVVLGTVSNQVAVGFDLTGAGPACGHWLLTTSGLTKDELVKIVGQLLPR